MNYPELRFKKNNGSSYPDLETKPLSSIIERKKSNLSKSEIKQKKSSELGEESEFLVYGADGIIGTNKKFQNKNPYMAMVKDGAGVGRIFKCNPKSSILATLDSIETKSPNNYEYVYQLLSNLDLSKFVIGSTIPHLYFNDYSKTKTLIPHPDEQAKIANCLSSIDVSINTEEKRIKLLENYKNGLMVKIFKEEIRFKNNNGTSFPDWKATTLGDIVSFSKGKGLSKSDIASTGKTPCIRYADLYTKYGTSINNITSFTNVDPDNLILSKGGEILIPSSGETSEDIAKASTVLQPGIAIGGDLNILVTRENSLFLSMYISSVLKDSLASKAQGVSVIHLYSTQIKSLRLNLPHIEEQNKIVKCLSSLDELLEFKQKTIELLKNHKYGLTQRLFVRGTR
jgi:type I restriction enzyme S subunit